MIEEMNMTAECTKCRSHLADLLLDAGYAAAHPEVSSHLEACAECREEVAALRRTFALLDEFHAPEPTPYFDTRLHARLREAQEAAPEGIWERMRSWVLFSTGRSFRPAVSGALALVLIAGGAGYVGVQVHQTTDQVAAQSSAVNDLKVLDNNESAEQQMGQLLDVSGAEDGDGQPAS